MIARWGRGTSGPRRKGEDLERQGQNATWKLPPSAAARAIFVKSALYYCVTVVFLLSAHETADRNILFQIYFIFQL